MPTEHGATNHPVERWRELVNIRGPLIARTLCPRQGANRQRGRLTSPCVGPVVTFIGMEIFGGSHFEVKAPRGDEM